MANVKITDATLLVNTATAMLPAGIAADATNYRVPARAIADAVIIGTNNDANDLAALNEAIVDNPGTSTARKVIKIIGTFAMGATRPSQIPYTTLDLTQAYMLQKANFTDAAPWLRGSGLQIVGGLFGSALGAVGASNSIVFGDTTTAGDFPMERADGCTFDATWDTLTAARTLVSLASTTAKVGYINISSLGAVSTSNRINVSVGSGFRGSCFLNGAWGQVVFSALYSKLFLSYYGGTTSTFGGDGSLYSIGSCGNTGTFNCGSSNIQIGIAGGGVLTFSGANNTVDIGYMSFYGITATSATGCTFRIGTSSHNAATYNLGTRCDWTVMSSDATNTLTLANATGCSFTYSGIGDGADVVLAATCDNSYFDITQSGSGARITVTGGATNNEVASSAPVTPNFTTTAAQCENIVYWHAYSTTVNAAPSLVSYKGPNRAARAIALADITGLGAGTSGQLAFFDLPAGKRVTRAFVLNAGTNASVITTLTASMGPTGTPTAILTASTVFLANAVSDTLGATLTQSYTAATAIIIEFVADAALNTTGGLTNGLVAVMEYV